MKVVLFALNSSFVHTNLAIRCLKQYIEKKNDLDIEVVLLEKNLRDRTSEVINALFEQKADIYAFSCYIFNVKEILPIAKVLSEMLPEAIVAFGGPEVSHDYDLFLKQNSFIDYIFTGEGERVFYDFLKKVKQKDESLSSNPIIHGGRYAGFVEQPMVYSTLDKPDGSIVYYESTRGCPYKCSYCLSSTLQGVRAKSVSDTLKDLYSFELLDTKIKIVKFVDRTFNYDLNRAKEIFKALLEDRFTKQYHMEMRPELFDDELIEILSKFPKDKVQFEIGIQSTNHTTLNAIDRPSNLEKAFNNIQKVRKVGNINIHCDLIAGLPYETMESAIKSFNDVYYNCDELQLGFLKLLKGSKIRTQAKEFHYIFQAEAPYEVYANMFINYEDMFVLKRVAALVDRFKNSGRFKQSIDHAVLFADSPFDLFSKLNREIDKHVSKISQENLFKVLFDFVKKNKNKRSKQDWEEFSKKIREDFTSCFYKNPPAYFS